MISDQDIHPCKQLLALFVQKLAITVATENSEHLLCNQSRDYKVLSDSIYPETVINHLTSIPDQVLPATDFLV